MNVNDSANRRSADQGLSRIHVPVPSPSNRIGRYVAEIRFSNQVIKRRR